MRNMDGCGFEKCVVSAPATSAVSTSVATTYAADGEVTTVAGDVKSDLGKQVGVLEMRRVGG